MRTDRLVAVGLIFGLGFGMSRAVAQSPPTSRPVSRAATRSDDTVLPIERPAIAGRRVVKHFDFDEKRFGNYDPYPMYWKQHEASGFRFTWKAGSIRRSGTTRP